MRRNRYPRYKEPVFSGKFTMFLILLALAAGIAVYIVFFTYPSLTGFGSPPEIRVDEPGLGNGGDGYVGAEPPGPSDDTPEPIVYEPTTTTEPTEGGVVQSTPSPSEDPGDVDDHVGFVLLTTVDNTQLPWYLKLVNRYNFLDYYFHPQLTAVGGGHYFDSRAYRSLLDMLDAARAEGLTPIVASSFRSVSRQTTLFNNRIQRFIDENGYDEEDAFEAARRIVAYPGTSEHNLGLAVDIVALSYQHLTENQATTPEGIWLAENSYRFGFVMRYPDDKQHITNIIFEPWHFRYVGREAAAEMFYRNLVLEEYVSELLAR